MCVLTFRAQHLVNARIHNSRPAIFAHNTSVRHISLEIFINLFAEARPKYRLVLSLPDIKKLFYQYINYMRNVRVNHEKLGANIVEHLVIVVLAVLDRKSVV